MDNLDTNATPVVTRTTGKLNGRGYSLVTFKGGRTEVYEDYADQPGLPRFLGYMGDILPHFPAIFARDLAPLMNEHAEAHAAYWDAYLPGAATWFN